MEEGKQLTLDILLSNILEKEKDKIFGSTVWRNPTQLEEIDPSLHEDLTDFLLEAPKYMEEGELIHNADFSLLESTSCLEALDPRMDNSVDLQKNVILNAEEALELGFCPSDETLTYPQVILFFDQLLTLEVGYYNGSTLIQTLGTCYYLYDYRKLRNPYVASLLRAVLKTCTLIRELIMSTDIYQEEDFHEYLYGISMCEHLEEMEILKLLTLSEEEIFRKLRKFQGKKGLEDVKSLQDNHDREKILCEALLARIRFRKAFYTSQSNMNKKKSVDQTKKLIANSLEYLPIITQTHQQVLDMFNSDNENNNNENFDLSSLFSSHIANRIYTSPPTVRPNIPNFENSVKFFEEYLNDCNKIYEISKQDDLKALSIFFHDFCKLQKPVVSRSRLYSMFTAGKKVFGRVEMSELVIKAINNYTINPVPIDQNNIKYKEFISRLSNTYLMKMNSLCNNRARLRRKMTYQFQEYGYLQSLAEEIDSDINELQLYTRHPHFKNKIKEGINNNSGVDQSSGNNINTMDPVIQAELKKVIDSRVQLIYFVSDLTIEWMIQYINLGFEMDIFSDAELRCVFWYLDYLYSKWGQIKLSHAVTVKHIHELKETNSGKGKRNKKIKKVKGANEPAAPPPTNEQLMIEALHALFRAIVLYLTGIYNRNGLKEPEYTFSSRSLQFFLRFSCFHHVRIPQPLLFDHFLAAVNVSDPSQLLPSAVSLFKYAQTCIDTVVKGGKHSPADVLYYKSLMRVAIANQINIIRIPEGTTGKIKFDFSVHPVCPIITITE